MPPNQIIRRGALIACGLARAVTAAGASAAAQTGDRDRASRTLYATTDQNRLLRFDAREPARVRATKAITNLPDDVTLQGIDFRPRTAEASTGSAATASSTA